MVTVHNPDSFSTILADPGMKWVTVDESYILTAIDAGVTVTGGVGVVITLLAGANIGTPLDIYNRSGSAITVNAGGAETVDGNASISLANGDKLSLRKVTAVSWEADKEIVNTVYPIGSYYTQYPDASNNTDATEFPTTQRPATMFGGTWVEQWATESVFFRTRGTNSDTDRVSGLQADEIIDHQHRINSGKGSHTHTINHDHASVTSSSNGAHTHDVQNINDSLTVLGGGSIASSPGDRTLSARTLTSTSAGDHTHTVDLPSFSGSSGAGTLPQIDTDTVLTVQVGTETRVKNRRIKVWKRTA